MNRRRFLTGFAGFLAAPAIVRVSSLMPVKALPDVYTLVQEPVEFTVSGWNQRYFEESLNNNEWFRRFMGSASPPHSNEVLDRDLLINSRLVLAAVPGTPSG